MKESLEYIRSFEAYIGLKMREIEEIPTCGAL